MNNEERLQRALETARVEGRLATRRANELAQLGYAVVEAAEDVMTGGEPGALDRACRAWRAAQL